MPQQKVHETRAIFEQYLWRYGRVELVRTGLFHKRDTTIGGTTDHGAGNHVRFARLRGSPKSRQHSGQISQCNPCARIGTGAANDKSTLGFIGPIRLRLRLRLRLGLGAHGGYCGESQAEHHEQGSLGEGKGCHGSPQLFKPTPRRGIFRVFGCIMAPPGQCSRIDTRSFATVWLCSWETLDSVMPKTIAISFKVISCS